MEGLDIEYI